MSIMRDAVSKHVGKRVESLMLDMVPQSSAFGMMLK